MILPLGLLWIMLTSLLPPPPPLQKKKNTKKRNIPFPKIIVNALGAISHCIVKSFRSIDNH